MMILIISLTNNQYIAAEDVSLILDYETIEARNYINRAKEEGVYINIAGKTVVQGKNKCKKLRSVIVLKNRTVLVSDLRPVTVYRRISNMSGVDEECE